jgi:hypothetical protein
MINLLSKILEEFEWPAPYTLEDDLPDGIIMTFPNSHLYFREGFEGDMLMEFLIEDTNTDHNLHLGHALSVIIPESQRDGTPLTPDLIDYWTPTASLEKVENGVRDLCRTVLFHLKPSILGDFSWVSKYLELQTSMAT